MEISFGNNLTITAYNNLRAAVGWRPLSERQAGNGIKNSAYLVTAIYQEQIIGMARVVSDGGYVAYIGDVIVHPDYQKQGIGKQMINNILDYLKEQLLEGEFMQVSLVAAKGREGFYKSVGFSQLPNESRGAGMRLDLIKIIPPIDK